MEASDIDVGDILTYSLGGTDGSSFGIDTATGQLRTSAALNFESDSSYSVTVGVDDGSGGTDSIDVTITVNDQNEKPDTPAAPTVTTTADTTDSLTVTWTKPGLNGGPDIVGYKLRYQSDGAWAEVPSTITATTHTIPNLAEGTTYQVQVRALNDGETDSDWSPSGSGTTGSSSNNPPEFDEGATAMRSVDENTGSGTAIGNPVSATDDDGDTLTYTLEGTDRTSFGIVARTGQLLTSAALDFESDSSHSVRVKVEDTNNGSATIDVTITVKRPEREAGQARRADGDGDGGHDRQPHRQVDEAGPERRAGHRRLQAAIPIRWRLDGGAVDDHGHDAHHPGPGGGHRVPGAGAGAERRRDRQRLVAVGHREHGERVEQRADVRRRHEHDAPRGGGRGAGHGHRHPGGGERRRRRRADVHAGRDGPDVVSHRLAHRPAEDVGAARLRDEASHSVRVKADDRNNGTATIAVTIEVEDVAEEATAAGDVLTRARSPPGRWSPSRGRRCGSCPGWTGR